jgi:hypothetical protein
MELHTSCEPADETDLGNWFSHTLLQLCMHSLPIIFPITVIGLLTPYEAVASHVTTLVSKEYQRTPLKKLNVQVMLSEPIYRTADAEETPYQLLQICKTKKAKQKCQIVLDVRGSGSFSLPRDDDFAFSPDGRYFILLRHAGIDINSKSIRKHYYQIIGVQEMAPVVFQTSDGIEAKADNILGWIPGQGHALNISLDWKKQAPAFPIPMK